MKINTIFSFVAALSASIVTAQSTSCETKSAQCGLSQKNTLTTTNTRTASAVNCFGDHGYFTSASLLFFQGNYVAPVITATHSTPNELGVGQEFNSKLLPNKLSPGCKVIFGKLLKHDEWSPLLLWTFFHANPKKTWKSNDSVFAPYLNSDVIKNFVLATAGTIQSPLANYVHTKWDMTFNSLDVEIGKNTVYSPFFATRSFGTIKAARVTNKLRADYKGLSNNWFDQSYLASNNAWLVGPRGGVNIYFSFIKDFGLAISTATSIYGVFSDLTTTQKVITPPGTGGNKSIGVKSNTKEFHIAPGFDGYFGLNYGHCFQKKFYLNTSLGYEVQFLGSAISPSQPLFMHGLNLTFLLNF
jgi:hypothetical protein